ncbi:MAG: anhydro-N-acetylmuramic acid kinase [candidate division Zixibacteria bacterium]|nr:anhydro-N-acetylmuramic acid kinase [candidate division Zixibacteria bacterium]
MNLKRLLEKKKMKVIGLMSGTSANGIDACLVEIERKNTRLKIKQLGFKTFSFPDSLQRKIIKVSDPGYQDVDEIIRLDFLLGEYFTNAAKKMAETCDFKLKDIDLIGSHGQTVRHLPSFKKMGNYMVRGTLQVGEPMIISTRTGIVTVADFKRKDIALGGEGAPLTPLAHYYLFNKEKKAQGILNLGGIANLTFLPRGKSRKKVWGMDLGPGNMLIDNLMRRYFNKNFDKDGNTAFKGKAVNPILDELLKKTLLLLEKKKSLGRENFDQEFTNDFIRGCRKYSAKPEDLVTTASELTVRSIHRNYNKFFKKKAKIEELILCGGGALNRYLFLRFKELFHPAKVYLSDDLGYNPLTVEPISFAIFAFLTLSQLQGDVPELARAGKTIISGKICLP